MNDYLMPGVPPRPAGDERRFHETMTYACDACSTALTFYLEDGCEGPRPFDPKTAVATAANWVTSSGRPIVPVPFVARRTCPFCGCERGFVHTNWSNDRALDPPIAGDQVPSGAGRFLYPAPDEVRSMRENACGRPVFPQEER